MASADATNSLLEGQYHFPERWQAALKDCESRIGSADYAMIREFQSPNAMVTAIDSLRREAAKESVSRHLWDWKPRIIQLTTLSLGIALGSGMDTFGVIGLWAFVTFMVKFAVRNDEMLEAISSMWTEISNGLQMLEQYKDFIEKDVALQESEFQILVELLLFAAETIKTMKNHPMSEHLRLNQSWTPLQNKFRTTCDKMASNIAFIKSFAEADLLKRQADWNEETMKHFRLQTKEDDKALKDSAGHDPANLPCYYVPFAPISSFYGREDILSRIEENIGSTRESGMVVSTAIWATAGIGKTQIALAYAARQQAKGVKAIFWIRSEDESESAKSFTEIAMALQLPGATNSIGHDQNRLIVHQWLQRTKTPWLMIFDNLESQRLLLLPSCGFGSILITCRSELLAASAASTAIEVPAFSNMDGGALLLKELGMTDAKAEDKTLASEVSHILGGHALAIDIMARHVKSRKKSLQDLLDTLEQNPRTWRKRSRDMKNMYYSNQLDAAWLLAFGQLETITARLFGVICMLAPDRVPLSMFIDSASVRKQVNIDKDDLDDAIVELKDLSLIRTTDDERALSVHRLIQGEFRAHITSAERHARWREAACVLHEAFPQQRKGFALFNEWAVCESLIEHVEALCEQFRAFALDDQPEYTEDFVYLTSDSSRYLLEIGRYNAAMHVSGSGFMHCKDENSLEYTNLCVIGACVTNERGRDKEALQYCDKTLASRRRLLPTDDPEIANALSNYALSLTGAGKDLETALTMLLDALRIDLLAPEQDRKRVLHLRHLNLGFAYKALGRIEEAKAHVETATNFVIAEFGPQSRYLCIVYRTLADFEIMDGNLAQAYEYADKSRQLALQQNSTNHWVAAALYKMADIRLKQDNAVEAIDLLRKARFIAEVNEREKGDQGDTARILHRLSKALQANSEFDESDEVGRKADAIYDALLATGEYTRVDDPELRWEYLVCIKFR